MIFFGSSNAVRNLRNDFPTRPRQPTLKAKKRTVNPSVRQVVVFLIHFGVVKFLSLRFMPVRHARFHWTSKFADDVVFGGFVDENDVGIEL